MTFKIRQLNHHFMNLAWLHMTEPFSEDELRAMEEVPVEHEKVEETISQFEACVQEILYLEPYRQTIHE